MLLLRAPEQVVNSYLAKGWYQHPFVRENPDRPPSFQPGEEFHHFLGRLVPSGEAFTSWQEMSRVGKLAWYWNALNAAVLEQLRALPGSD